jgi:hypothetical protein
MAISRIRENGSQTDQVNHLMGEDVQQKGIEIRLQVFPLCDVQDPRVIQLNPVEIAPGAFSRMDVVQFLNPGQRFFRQWFPLTVLTRYQVILELLAAIGGNAIVAERAFLGLVQGLDRQIALAF